MHRETYKKTIVFALNVDNAIALSKLFNENGVKADFVVSTIIDKATGISISSKETERKIAQFRNGELEVLVNMNILTEGTDIPDVQSIFLARPTKSSILMIQMIGRGLRGVKAGGSPEAYIVNFVDKWREDIRQFWQNPEKLFIDETVDFPNPEIYHGKIPTRIISISKLEEFAILANASINTEAKEELEKLNFIERVPVGTYDFSYLDNNAGEDKTVHIVVYDNQKQSYTDFINGLPDFFAKYKLTNKDDLTNAELKDFCPKIENDYFFGIQKYPKYEPQDIKDILRYYSKGKSMPKFLEFKDREKFDLAKVANEIINTKLGESEKQAFMNVIWNNNDNESKEFIGLDNFKYFRNEINLIIDRLLNPDDYKRPDVIPQDNGEKRKLEEMDMDQIRTYNPRYWRWLSDQVYEKFKVMGQDGFYKSAISDYKSKNKLDFHIDHIKPMSKGGLTTLDNLQLLTRKENAEKGAKYEE